MGLQNQGMMLDVLSYFATESLWTCRSSPVSYELLTFTTEISSKWFRCKLSLTHVDLAALRILLRQNIFVYKTCIRATPVMVVKPSDRALFPLHMGQTVWLTPADCICNGNGASFLVFTGCWISFWDVLNLDADSVLYLRCKRCARHVWL